MEKCYVQTRRPLYGWDILLAGTAWPRHRQRHAGLFVKRQHYETGLHADHHAWQTTRHRHRQLEDIARHNGVEAIIETGHLLSCVGWRAMGKCCSKGDVLTPQ